MSLLPRTEVAFAELAANTRLALGSHHGEDIMTGHEGVFVGERLFDPVRDSPADINHLSIWEMITDEPHVAMRIPEYPLNVRIVSHERATPDSDRLGITKARKRLMNSVIEALDDALPNPNDRVLHYRVGQAVNENQDREAEVIVTDGRPETDAAQIADICSRGLTVVLSDFLRLPLETQADSGNFESTIAIKANHALDLKLPSNVGVLSSGHKGGEINTNTLGSFSRGVARFRKQPVVGELSKVNEALSASHQRAISCLEDLNIPVAQLVLQPQRQFGFDVMVADESIAKAVTHISQNNDQ